jgi:hypothetical protein
VTTRIALRPAASLALALATIDPLAAQGTAPAAGSAAAPASKPVTLDALKGTWVRPDGGYLIVIKSVGPDGRLDAMYFNPAPLPFAKAEATLGVSLRAHFELRAGGYAGSTYDLTYDPVSDRLHGTYYQAVAKQKFDVYFTRK